MFWIPHKWFSLVIILPALIMSVNDHTPVNPLETLNRSGFCLIWALVTMRYIFYITLLTHMTFQIVWYAADWFCFISHWTFHALIRPVLYPFKIWKQLLKGHDFLKKVGRSNTMFDAAFIYIFPCGLPVCHHLHIIARS